MDRPKSSFATIEIVTLLLFLIPALRHSLLTARLASSSLTVTVTSPLHFTLRQEGETVPSATVLLKNTAKTALNWSMSSDQAWLRFTPSSGSLPQNASISVSVTPHPEGFSPGVYESIIKVTKADSEPHTLTATMIEQSPFSDVPLTNAERTFPPDSGMANVKTLYGAKGDGVSDDTAAIQLAISSTVHHSGPGPRIVYFPAGIYLVSRPLVEKDLTSRWNSLLTLQGENRATTIIKLTDENRLYQNAATPADVLELASQNGRPNGAGNSAFDNNIFDITIDVGRGNPGAIALDFLGNNYCAIRNVSLQSSDPNHAGAIGLDLRRYAAGPCLMKNLLINGFDYGIRTAHNEYSLTFEDLTLLNQRLFGILNANNVLSIRHLVSANSVPALSNQTTAGLITLLDAILRGGSANYSAIENHGTLYARNVKSSGYGSVLGGQGQMPHGSSIDEYDSGPAITPTSGKDLSLNLPIEETPLFEDDNLSNWKSVVAYGADPTGKLDSSTAIQAAIDSGATTVYFPTGVYSLARTIHIRGKVRVLEGFGSSLNPFGSLFQNTANPVPIFKVEAGTSEVALNHMRIAAFYPHPCPGVIGVQQDSARALVLRDSIIGGTPTMIAYQNTSRGTGILFIENLAAQPWHILFPQNVFARQLDPEGNATKIVNRGGTLWVLGLKTEGTGTNIETTENGSTEVLGGLIYPVWRVPVDSASFVVKDSRASFIYAVSNYKPAVQGTNFAIQVLENQNGAAKSLLSTSLPTRGLGVMIPLYRSADPSGYPAHESGKATQVGSSH